MGIIKQSIELPINEAVRFLHRANPSALEKFRDHYPSLSEELKLGKIAGADEDAERFYKEKAEIMSTALSLLKERALSAYKNAFKGLRRNRKIKLFCEILVVVGSATILTTLSTSTKELKVLAATTALIGSVGAIFVEHSSKFTSPELGSLDIACTEFYAASQEANILIVEIKAALATNLEMSELKEIIGRANSLLQKSHRWPSMFTS